MTLVELQKEVAEKKGLVLVKFSAEWCAPCKALRKTIEELSVKDFSVIEVDAGADDFDSDISAHYAVRNLPFVVMFKDGVQVDKFTGAKPKPQLEELIKKHL